MVEYANAIGQGLKTGVDIANSIQQGGIQGQEMALKAENTRQTMENYAQTMKPIDMGEIAKTLPPYLHAPMLTLANSMGIVEQEGDKTFVRAGKLKGFLEEFGKNKVLQATAYEGAKGILTEETKKLTEMLKPKEEQLKTGLAYYESMMKDYQDKVVSDAQKLGKPAMLDPMKLSSIEKKKQEYLAANKPLVDEVEGLKKKIMDSNRNFYKVTTQSGIIDDAFKKHETLYGTEDAIRLNLGQVTADQLNYKLKVMESKARQEALQETEAVKGLWRKDIGADKNASQEAIGAARNATAEIVAAIRATQQETGASNKKIAAEERIYNRIEQSIQKRAAQNTVFKYKDTFKPLFGSNGNITLDSYTEPDAAEHYNNLVEQYREEEISKAIKRGALSKEYETMLPNQEDRAARKNNYIDNYLRQNVGKVEDKKLYTALRTDSKNPYSDKEIAEAWKRVKGGQ